MDECLNEYIQTAEESLELLQELLAEIKVHQDRCIGLQEMGITFSVLGGIITIASIALAPATAGASLVGVGYGIATGAAGAVTKAGEAVADMIFTKNYSGELLQIDSRLEDVAKRFYEYVDQIEAEAARIIKEDGVQEEEGWRQAMVLLLTTGKIAWKGKQVTGIALNMGPTTGSTLLKNGVNKMGFDVSKRVAFSAVKSATVVLNAAFIFWDLKSVAGIINSDHILAEPVETQIVLQQFKDLLNESISKLHQRYFGKYFTDDISTKTLTINELDRLFQLTSLLTKRILIVFNLNKSYEKNSISGKDIRSFYEQYLSEVKYFKDEKEIFLQEFFSLNNENQQKQELNFEQFY
ncbi:unnamed protein product [Adineta steineri]|uniref:Uncharacterized protein n=1 Tax=Adineta steineri TaxID=433720 RepID=A0A813TEX7_9BILA|nr:unnamed protein product [Adineta steineri]CAF0819788.1 unnamed protein product [Adineta steineri]